MLSILDRHSDRNTTGPGHPGRPIAGQHNATGELDISAAQVNSDKNVVLDNPHFEKQRTKGINLFP